jgi:hypothetical protein
MSLHRAENAGEVWSVLPGSGRVLSANCSWKWP